jgi:hypothetical protein
MAGKNAIMRLAVSRFIGADNPYIQVREFKRQMPDCPAPHQAFANDQYIEHTVPLPVTTSGLLIMGIIALAQSGNITIPMPFLCKSKSSRKKPTAFCVNAGLVRLPG